MILDNGIRERRGKLEEFPVFSNVCLTKRHGSDGFCSVFELCFCLFVIKSVLKHSLE